MNEDGSQLTGVTGYKIRYGTSATNLSSSVDVAGSTVTSFVVRNLPVATYYFSVATVTTGGGVSSPSTVASIAIR